MKFLVPNYSCLQNPWLGGYRPQIPVLSVLCPQLKLLNPPPEKIPGYATGLCHYITFYLCAKLYRVELSGEWHWPLRWHSGARCGRSCSSCPFLTPLKSIRSGNLSSEFSAESGILSCSPEQDLLRLKQRDLRVYCLSRRGILSPPEPSFVFRSSVRCRDSPSKIRWSKIYISLFDTWPFLKNVAYSAALSLQFIRNVCHHHHHHHHRHLL